MVIPAPGNIPMQRAPFPLEHQLNYELDSLQAPCTGKEGPLRLPGQPRIHMNDPAAVTDYLRREFLLKDFEELASHLWMMSKQDSANVSPLHRQKVKNREIIVTEDPRLHIVWYHDRIFIKPLPKYLLSHKFWQAYLSIDFRASLEQENLRKAALGFLRTYYHLIRYESDFRIAINADVQLVPAGITYLEFCDFAAHLGNILDSEVSGRYAYGEVRLTRLNFYSKIFLGKFNFHRISAQYSDYFASFYGPILFAFAILSLVLSAMQVGMAIEALKTSDQWRRYWGLCRWFSVACLGLVLILVLWLITLFLYKFVAEWVYALGDRQRLKKAAKAG
ncbi:MAG: hypothetical protein M1819_005556 [Sarea resinae]|nr:MAG: hypothetical protein M1819_005556 [Sarea resinae]